MNTQADLVISKDDLKGLQISPGELRVELAVYLYATKSFSMGRARRLAGLDLISFQHELAKRNIYIHYTVEDLRQDVANLDKFFEKAAE